MVTVQHFSARMGAYVLDWILHLYWILPLAVSGFFLYRVCAAFLPVKQGRGWRGALFLLLGGVSGMVIWVGDDNLLFILPVFFGVFLACSKGDRIGRAAVAVVFFCLILSVCALLDTYYVQSVHEDPYAEFYFITSKLLRPLLAGLLYLALRKRLPERPPQLPPRLWRLVLLLAAMPLCALLSVVLLTQNKYDSPALQATAMSLGLAVLPFVLLSSLALLYAILVLADHRRLEEAEKLASLRESYYRNLRREERQVRTLRHDLRNHLTVLRGLLDQGEMERAAGYLAELADSPALGGRRILCENETAGVVLAAKAEDMEQAGIAAEFAVSLPKDLPIPDTDLCALLGNALDNAMEAAAGTERKRVTVRCRAEKGLFMLRVENDYAGELPPDLATSKADKAAHGFGLAGMREIAERWGGSLEVRGGGGRFQLVACLPLDGGAVGRP